MRIFINNVDSYVGRALCADLRSVHDQPNKLLGTVMSEKVDSELMQSMGVKRVVSRAQQKIYLKDVATCSLIVYDLHSADPADVEAVIKHLKVAELEHETTFVLISSVNVWARTKKEYVPIETEEEEEDEGEEELDDEGNPIGKVKKAPKVRPKELTDQDLDRRIPSPDHETWKYLETLALSLGSREKLRPHVIASGILYGNGETTFNELFKAAWLTQSTHKIIHPGDNYIPCVHVRDVARLVKVVAVDKNVGSYLIAVDKARLTQAEIVQGIVNQISNAAEIPVHDSKEVEGEFKDIMMLNLIMQPSAPMLSKNFEWWCKHGLVKNIEKVAAEFCKWRNLRPIKMVICGPPGAGAERFCSMVADRYLHEDPPHLTFKQILDEALQQEDAAFAADPEGEMPRRLREKVEKAIANPGAKIPLKTCTRLVKKKLMSNVCRYRGYVLEGYPENYEEADALFTELVLAEGEEPPEENPDEEEEDEEAPPKEEEEDEDEAEPKPQRKVNDTIVPEFVVQLESTREQCKNRIFSGYASGAANEDEFVRKTQEYQRANLAQDGSRGMQDFFGEGAGLRVLHADVDKSSETEVFESIRVYMESKGQFFNYLRSEEELVREREEARRKVEEAEDQKRQKALNDRRAAEARMTQGAGADEATRRQAIAESEAALLEAEAMPLRQYLLANVVPTLSEGLTEVCKEQPDDPIEYLAQYLFAHAQDIAPALAAANSTKRT